MQKPLSGCQTYLLYGPSQSAHLYWSTRWVRVRLEPDPHADRRDCFSFVRRKRSIMSCGMGCSLRNLSHSAGTEAAASTRGGGTRASRAVQGDRPTSHATDSGGLFSHGLVSITPPESRRHSRRPSASLPRGSSSRSPPPGPPRSPQPRGLLHAKKFPMRRNLA